MTDIDEEEWTVASDATIPETHLVGMAANGVDQWLVMKQDAAGLLDADYVRGLIAKSEPETTETVTMSGSPAAIAALIHGAPIRKADPTPQTYEQIVKAKYNADDLKRMAANGQAMKDESYPIADKEDLGRAIHAVGRGGSEHDAIRHHIITRAKSLGASSEIPDTWGADGSLKKSGSEPPEQTEVTKDMDVPDAADCAILAEPDPEVPGDPNDPGSPAWESIDSDTACMWTAVAARLRAAIEVLADREDLEAVTVDPDDAENAMNLRDAACALDYVISVLAPFVIDEQAESDMGAMEMVGKAMTSVKPSDLATVESLTAVRKAGRTLSASNESALRSAIQALQQILASLPKAPDAATPSGQPVAKTANEEPNMPEPTLTEDVTAASGQEPAMGAASPEPKPVAGAVVTDVTKTADVQPAPVAKAEKTPQVAIYDANGNLVGTVDPAEITMLAPAKAPEAAAKSDDTAPEEPAATAEAPDAPPADLAPAPAASVGTPADAAPADDDTVAKATENSTAEDTQNVLKGSITEMVKAAIAEQSAPQGELIKSLEGRNQALEEQNAELVKKAASLEERLTRVENQPAVMAIASNGAIPAAHQMRGQDRGAQVDMTQGQILKARLAASDDATEKKQIADEMQALALAKFQEMRRP